MIIVHFSSPVQDSYLPALSHLSLFHSVAGAAEDVVVVVLQKPVAVVVGVVGSTMVRVYLASLSVEEPVHVR